MPFLSLGLNDSQTANDDANGARVEASAGNVSPAVDAEGREEAGRASASSRQNRAGGGPWRPAPTSSTLFGTEGDSSQGMGESNNEETDNNESDKSVRPTQSLP